MSRRRASSARSKSRRTRPSPPITAAAGTISRRPRGPDVGIYGTAGDWDLIGGDDGTIDIYGAQASVVGQADTIDFVDDNVDDAVSVYATSGKWDEISGSDGLVYLTDAQANVFGGGDTVRLAGDGDAVSLYGTDGNWDAVGVDDATVYATSAQTNVERRRHGEAGLLRLRPEFYDTDGNWDAVGAVDVTVYATGAQTNVDGGGDMIKLVGDGAAVSLTTNGNWDGSTQTTRPSTRPTLRPMSSAAATRSSCPRRTTTRSAYIRRMGIGIASTAIMASSMKRARRPTSSAATIRSISLGGREIGEVSTIPEPPGTMWLATTRRSI